MIADLPVFTTDTSEDDSGSTRPGTLRVHPNSQVVYVANRAGDFREVNGKPVSVGGDNSIAVFSVNQTTGEPTRIQNVDTRGMEPRTFALDAAGRLLVVGNQTPLYVSDGQSLKHVPASLSVFRIGQDGRLTFASKTDVPTVPGGSLYWMTVASLP